MEFLKNCWKWTLVLLTFSLVSSAIGVALLCVGMSLKLPDILMIPFMAIAALLGGVITVAVWKISTVVFIRRLAESVSNVFKLDFMRQFIVGGLLIIFAGLVAYLVMPKWEYMVAREGADSGYIKWNKITGQCYKVWIENGGELVEKVVSMKEEK